MPTMMMLKYRDGRQLFGGITAMLSCGPWADSIPHEVFSTEWAEAAPDKAEVPA